MCIELPREQRFEKNRALEDFQSNANDINALHVFASEDILLLQSRHLKSTREARLTRFRTVMLNYR
jgi:hypothetical protein